ncbi:hypothetical protein LZ31DRAFT_322143 [Colletotrichum somersetense]|nr:hypothetical protein LZ31DRAFT_322143 [Colletotrichum somersetense]
MAINVDCAGGKKVKPPPARSAAQRVLSRRHGRSENATERKTGRHARPPGGTSLPHSVTQSLPQLHRPAARNTLAPRTWWKPTTTRTATDDRVANPSCPYCIFFLLLCGPTAEPRPRRRGAKVCALGTCRRTYLHRRQRRREAVGRGARAGGRGAVRGRNRISPIVHSFTGFALVHTGS